MLMSQEDTMNPEITAAIISALVALVVAGLGWLQQRRFLKAELKREWERRKTEFALQCKQFEEDFQRDREQVRTTFMAEQLALEWLNTKEYELRTFKEISRRLGGFEPDELRRILVRAGAIRFYRRVDQEEMWGLLSRPAIRKLLGNPRYAETSGIEPVGEAET
jgi:hypothetical protein